MYVISYNYFPLLSCRHRCFAADKIWTNHPANDTEEGASKHRSNDNTYIHTYIHKYIHTLTHPDEKC